MRTYLKNLTLLTLPGKLSGSASTGVWVPTVYFISRMYLPKAMEDATGKLHEPLWVPFFVRVLSAATQHAPSDSLISIYRSSDAVTCRYYPVPAHWLCQSYGLLS